MATQQSINLKILYNGEDLTEHFVKDALNTALNDAVANAIKGAVQRASDRVWSIVINDMKFNYAVVGVRPAVRQSCLWRHSFDWRNRKRGHPVHRRVEA